MLKKILQIVKLVVNKMVTVWAFLLLSSIYLSIFPLAHKTYKTYFGPSIFASLVLYALMLAVYFMIIYRLRYEFKELFLNWKLDDLSKPKKNCYPTNADIPDDIHSLIINNACMITKFYNKKALIDCLKLKNIQASNWEITSYTQDFEHIFISPKIGDDVMFFGPSLDVYMHSHGRTGNSSVYFKYISHFSHIDELFLFFGMEKGNYYGWSWIQNGRVKRSLIALDGTIVEQGDITTQELIVKAKREKDLSNEEISSAYWVDEDTVFDVMRLWCKSVEDLEQLTPSVGEAALSRQV